MLSFLALFVLCVSDAGCEHPRCAPRQDTGLELAGEGVDDGLPYPVPLFGIVGIFGRCRRAESCSSSALLLLLLPRGDLMNPAPGAQVVPGLVHRPHNRVYGLGNVQQRRRARGTHTGRETVKNRADFALRGRRPAESDPRRDARREPRDALSHEEDVAVDEAAEGKGVDGAVELREGVEDDTLEAGDAFQKLILKFERERERERERASEREREREERSVFFFFFFCSSSASPIESTEKRE